ncbi:AraD1 family protein [Phycisphaerales bacterium AB-hyl4]|uniref:AraD1 family protein n=1 Tax=Natronomicrosphaera hydrolytica TaxID=3242702 RepID=A0ABV4U9M8_9BACT
MRDVRLVQLQRSGQRAVAIVEGDALVLLHEVRSAYGLADQAAEEGEPLAEIACQLAKGDRLDYDAIYTGTGDWRLLPCWDHPDEPARCLVTGTGLTHQASADNRQAMHELEPAELTDSMKMYRWGLEGGRPAPGCIGVAPEWFFKGVGTVLCAHGQPLTVPPFGESGGEEPEIAGCYFVDAKGRPRRVGFATANEFSDHALEKRNYLYLAPSKLRECALGPELCISADFEDVRGEVCIERDGQTLWFAAIATGEANMCHSLANLEHHHFKYPQHRRPGDAHVHFLGADAFSYGTGVELRAGDRMVVQWSGFGRPLVNPLCVARERQTLVKVQPL